jgi:hypothetical protein
MTSRCSSVREKRESGSPSVAGSSQASAFTDATCSGGKTARAARALAILKPCQSLLEEALPPPAYDPRRRFQTASDLGGRLPVGGVEDHLRPHDNLVRQRVTRNPALQLGALLAAQLDQIPAPTGHHHPIRRRRLGPFNNHGPNFRTGVLAPASTARDVGEALDAALTSLKESADQYFAHDMTVLRIYNKAKHGATMLRLDEHTHDENDFQVIAPQRDLQEIADNKWYDIARFESAPAMIQRMQNGIEHSTGSIQHLAVLAWAMHRADLLYTDPAAV